MTRVHVAPIDGSSPRLLTQSPSTVPAWSPDGRWIAFSPDRSFTGGVFIIASDGSGQRQLTKTGGWPTWWPDGNRIGYIAVRPDGNQEIQLVSRDGGTPVTLSHVKFDGTNHLFDVSSKGQLVSSNSSHLTTEIWLMEPGK
jgi:Tol biopolymer transport system component